VKQNAPENKSNQEKENDKFEQARGSCSEDAGQSRLMGVLVTGNHNDTVAAETPVLEI
jgi:hypothetical protein